MSNEHSNNNEWWQAIEREIDGVYREYSRERRKIKVLDLGCADGTNIMRLWKITPEAEYYGIDIDREKIQSAIKGKKEVMKFVCADIIKKPFPKGKFDFILCSEVFEHLYDNEKIQLTNKINEALKMDGILVITTPTPDAFFRQLYESNNKIICYVIDKVFKNTYKERILADFSWGRHHHIGVCNERYYERLFLRKGFHIIKKVSTEAFQYPLHPLIKKLMNFIFIQSNPWRLKFSASIVYVCQKVSEEIIEY